MKRLLIILLLFLSGCSVGTYEGLTAEEWFDEYDSIEAQNQDLRYQLSDLEMERDELQGQYDEIEAEKYELENCVNNAYTKQDADYCIDSY